jgi:hypothetical protein
MMPTGWLIEHVHDGSVPLWLYVPARNGIAWTSAATDALRISRKDDADALIALWNLGRVAVATEHAWNEASPSAPR